MVAITIPAPSPLVPAGGRGCIPGKNPVSGAAGRRSRTLSELTIVAFAASRCRCQTGPPVEGAQPSSPGGHVTKSPQPHESIRVINVAELAEHHHPECFLALDELSIKKIHENIALAWMQRVLTQLDDRRPAHSGIIGDGSVELSSRPALPLMHGLDTRDRDGSAFLNQLRAEPLWLRHRRRP